MTKDPVYQAMIEALSESEEGRIQRMAVLEMEEQDSMRRIMKGEAEI
jgi:hypothetical protein